MIRYDMINGLHWKTGRQAAGLIQHINQENWNCFKWNWNERSGTIKFMHL